jgi:hypothetical protein
MGGSQVNLSIVLIRIRRTAPKWFAHTQALCFPHTSQLWGSVGCGSSSLLRRSVAERSARAVPCCGATVEFGADHGQFPLWDWTKTQRHQKTEFSFSRWLGWGPPICGVALLHVPKHTCLKLTGIIPGSIPGKGWLSEVIKFGEESSNSKWVSLTRWKCSMPGMPLKWPFNRENESPLELGVGTLFSDRD